MSEILENVFLGIIMYIFISPFVNSALGIPMFPEKPDKFEFHYYTFERRRSGSNSLFNLCCVIKGNILLVHEYQAELINVLKKSKIHFECIDERSLSNGVFLVFQGICNTDDLFDLEIGLENGDDFKSLERKLLGYGKEAAQHEYK